MGATPSAPASGELVVHWEGRSATHARGPHVAPMVRAWVYADGRMIWSREGSVPEGANEFTSGYLEQRLTPEGVELLRSAVAELFDRSRALVQTVPADPRPSCRRPVLIVPPFQGSSGGNWKYPAATGSSASGGVTWKRGSTLEARRRRRSSSRLSGGSTRCSPTRRRCCRRARGPFARSGRTCRRTTQCASAPRRRRMRPSSCPCCRRGPRTCSATRAGHGSEGDIEASPDGGGPVEVQGRWVKYCSKLTTEEAREVAEALSGLDPEPRLVRLAYRLAEGAHWWEGTSIWFEPYFPHGQVPAPCRG